MSSFAKFLSVVGSAAVAVANAHVESTRRDTAYLADAAEAQRWENRRQAVVDTVTRAVVAKQRNSSSTVVKERIAARMRGEAAEFALKRSEPLMQMVEQQAARFEQHGC